MFIGAGVELTRFKYGFDHLLAKFSNLDALMLKFVVYLKLKFNWVLSLPLFYLATLNMPHLLRGLVKSLLCVNLARFYPQLFNQMLI